MDSYREWKTKERKTEEVKGKGRDKEFRFGCFGLCRWINCVGSKNEHLWWSGQILGPDQLSTKGIC